MTHRAGRFERYGQLASGLYERPRDAAVLSEAKQVIDCGEGAMLFDVLLACARERTEGQHAFVPTLMSILEEMMDAQPSIAAYLMAKLYSVSGRTRHHEVYDAIELWMHDSSSVEVADVLNSLAQEPIRPLLKKRYREWSNAIRARAASLGHRQ